MSQLAAPVLGSDALASIVEALAGVCDGDGVDDVELLARLRELEAVKSAAAAAQVRVTKAFAVSREAAAAAAREAAKGNGFKAWRAARDSFRGSDGVAEQVALARRLSPWAGGEQVRFANDMATFLPHTLAALTGGVLSEYRASIIARETGWLSASDRAAVDEEVAADAEALSRMGNRELAQRVRAAAYRRDSQGAVDRARSAANDRGVSIRPQPDVMCRLSALLPVAQGVATYAELSRTADTARASGDPRSRGQVMADTLVERVTGQASADAVSVEVQVVITDSALLNTDRGAEDPGQVPGYGTVPAGWVRDLLLRQPTGTDDDEARVWLRRLYATPDKSTLVAMESSRRLFDAGLRRFLLARDGTCRTPWCDAPIRHLDHVQDHARGGPTSTDNGQGLCERCNHTKQLPGWAVESLPIGRDGPHRVRWRTPTGLTYDSTAPPLLPGNTDHGTVVQAELYLSPLEVEIAYGLAA